MLLVIFIMCRCSYDSYPHESMNKYEHIVQISLLHCVKQKKGVRVLLMLLYWYIRVPDRGKGGSSSSIEV